MNAQHKKNTWVTSCQYHGLFVQCRQSFNQATIFFQEALHNITGRRTVPNVFIKGKSIGGGSETAELYQSGKLREMLQEQGIIK